MCVTGNDQLTLQILNKEYIKSLFITCLLSLDELHSYLHALRPIKYTQILTLNCDYSDSINIYSMLYHMQTEKSIAKREIYCSYLEAIHKAKWVNSGVQEI